MPSVTAIGAVAVLLLGPIAASAAEWLNWGHGLSNLRYNPLESDIGPSNVAQLELKFNVTTDGDTSATPAVTPDGRLFIVDFGGGIRAINATDGSLLWRRAVSSYLPRAPGAVASRTTPAVDMASGLMVIGTMLKSPGGWAWVVAVNITTGDAVWRLELDQHPAALITQSPTIANGSVYIGTSSTEEGLAAVVPGYRWACEGRSRGFTRAGP